MPVRKFQRTFAHRVLLYHLVVLSSLVCTCADVLVWVCIEVWPFHTTSAEPISAVMAAVEAPFYALHSPLPASKTVLSSWSLVVVCPLVAPNATEIEARTITGSWYQRYHYTSSIV